MQDKKAYKDILYYAHRNKMNEMIKKLREKKS